MGLSVFLRTLSSETTNDPIVHPRKIRHIAWLLLAAVLWYHCSLSLFYHTHTVDGVAVTHSHPYTGTPDAPRHAHSAVQFAAIAAPWHVLAALANPPYETAEGIFSKNWEGQGFFWYYIIHEHFLRYIDAETSMREQPWFFFLILAPVGLIPWIVALPQSVWSEIKGGYRNLREKNPEFMHKNQNS